MNGCLGALDAADRRERNAGVPGQGFGGPIEQSAAGTNLRGSQRRRVTQMAQANKKQQYVKAVSPVLTLKFPKLSEPDYGTQDYPKPDGEYSTKGLLDADSPEAKKFIAQLQPHFDEAIAEAERKFKDLKVETRKKLGSVKVNDLFTTLYDQETEEPTGEIEFKFAMPASGTYKKGPKEGKKWTAKPGIVDSMGQIMVKPPAIWGGSPQRPPNVPHGCHGQV